MSNQASLDLVTGAFSYTGSHIAARLLREGRSVKTLTFHPDRAHPLQASVEACRYRFDDPAALTRSLEGVSTLYNTFWVRFDHGSTSFANAIECSRMLFHAARNAGVQRIVHVSIANPSIDSPLPYFRGKALVEYALAETGVPYSIVRPTWVFGGERDVLANNIAWILRRMPLFALPGNGKYPVQPVHVEDLARICVEAARFKGDTVVDAAGPKRMAFSELVACVRSALDTRSPIVHVPPPLMALAACALGLFVRDVVLTREEIKGLMAGLLVSHDPPLGQISFSSWLNEHKTSVGHSYANELDRHFATSVAAA
ncbi:MAG TPA: NAD(P)H-binding protein [Solirubrobacteraceae bacterium]|nr:NAD(P)H-binding protein [Solirubrobacteraceae bacterium]